MIVMDWRIPKDILERQPIIKLHVLYGNYTEKTLDYPIKSRMGFATYKDLDKEYADTKGIITYSAEIVLDDGEIYKSWKHQLWVKLITLDEEPKDTQLSSFAGSDEVFEEEDVISYQEDEELFDEEQEDLSSISADSISASVDDQPIQGSVIDTEDLIDDTSSEID
jgi:hypothetical protein